MFLMSVTLMSAAIGAFALLGIAVLCIVIGTEHGLRELDLAFFLSGIVVLLVSGALLVCVGITATQVKGGEWHHQPDSQEQIRENP